MYAVLWTGTIGAGRFEEAMQVLRDQIVPMVKGSAGFKKGTWFGSETSGNALMLFDSEESARAIAQVAMPPDAAVQADSVQVFEVHAEA